MTGRRTGTYFGNPRKRDPWRTYSEGQDRDLCNGNVIGWREGPSGDLGVVLRLKGVQTTYLLTLETFTFLT